MDVDSIFLHVKTDMGACPPPVGVYTEITGVQNLGTFG